jgi:quercetin dioxygenase-like cupin family protein
MEQPKEDRIAVGELEMRFFVDGRHTSGHVSIAEMIVPPRAKVPPAHAHEDIDETVQVLEGTLHYRIGETTHVLRAGDRAFSPRGLPHAFANHGDVTTRALLIFSPAKIGPEYFREIGALLGAGGAPDFARVKSVMEK